MKDFQNIRVLCCIPAPTVFYILSFGMMAIGMSFFNRECKSAFFLYSSMQGTLNNYLPSVNETSLELVF